MVERISTLDFGTLSFTRVTDPPIEKAIRNESLIDLKRPERVAAIKKEHYTRMHRKSKKSRSTTSWQDDILSAEGEGCASCFI